MAAAALVTKSIASRACAQTSFAVLLLGMATAYWRAEPDDE
jgi:hypothetical protein